jgi:hypothetical protein
LGLGIASLKDRDAIERSETRTGIAAGARHDDGSRPVNSLTSA